MSRLSTVSSASAAVSYFWRYLVNLDVSYVGTYLCRYGRGIVFSVLITERARGPVRMPVHVS
jgi:hypothetical protein